MSEVRNVYVYTYCPMLELVYFLSDMGNICIYNIYFQKINSSSRTNSNILIFAENFQQNKFGNFQ